MVHRRTDALQGLVVQPSDAMGQGRLHHGVERIAVDDRFALESDAFVIEGNLGGETSNGGGDLGHGDQGADVEHLAPGQHEDGPGFSPDLCEPHVSPDHSSPQVSASVQEGSGSSGCRW